METEAAQTNVLQLNGQNPTPDILRIQSLPQILADTEVTPPAIVGNGVLLDNTLLLIYGEPKARKTFLLSNMMLAIATGKTFAGFVIPRPEKVLLLSAEGGRVPALERIRKMSEAINLDLGENFKIVADCRLNLLNPENVNTLRNTIIAVQPKVVGLDPLSKFHDGDENSSQEMTRVFHVIRELSAEYGVAFVVVHHKGKNRSKTSRGSSVITAEYDSAISIEKAINRIEHSVSFDMRHVATPNDRKLTFDETSFWFTDPNVNPVLNLLLQMEWPVSRSDLSKGCEEAGICSRTNAYARIDSAVRNNLILVANGMYSPAA